MIRGPYVTYGNWVRGLGYFVSDVITVHKTKILLKALLQICVLYYNNQKIKKLQVNLFTYLLIYPLIYNMFAIGEMISIC